MSTLAAQLNGRNAQPDQLRVLATTNYGHYTSMRVENLRTRGLVLHLERLERDCWELFGVALDLDRVRALLRHALNGDRNATIARITIFDPEVDIAHVDQTRSPGVLVTFRPAAALPPSPMRVQSVQHARDMPAIKHAGIFSALMLRRRAQVAGFDDALFVNGQQQVSEGATWNVGFHDGNQLIWPDADALQGVTMSLLNSCHDGTIVNEPISVALLDRMQTVFATHSGVGVRPISGIDDMSFDPQSQIIQQLEQEYLAIPTDEI